MPSAALPGAVYECFDGNAVGASFFAGSVECGGCHKFDLGQGGIEREGAGHNDYKCELDCCAGALCQAVGDFETAHRVGAVHCRYKDTRPRRSPVSTCAPGVSISVLSGCVSFFRRNMAILSILFSFDFHSANRYNPGEDYDVMTPTRELVLTALGTVIDPDFRKDLVTLGMIKDVVIDGPNVAFTVELTTPACPLKERSSGCAARPSARSRA